MKIIVFNDSIQDSLVSAAAGVLLDNGILIHPTENLYGFGANLFDTASIKKIMEIKKRKKNTRGFIVLVADYIQLDRLIDKVSKTEKNLMQKYWPGPLTILLRAKKEYWHNPVCYKKKFAIRMVGNEITRAILKQTNLPMISTSINISGHESMNDVNQIKKKFQNDVQGMIIDTIHSFNNKPSTIVKVFHGKVIHIRKGAIYKPNPKLQ
ncbi:MAG TPA: threonylcarbamoyl-AMP synthase [Candidatus Cloacimonetes bacterium]|nr:threonylcarbamoyl-AMP synthase [Candidatus Cloacimonadota bacterium]HEX37495.1 threonylcarbamoyl-AMP synthase [Candidatus Cloacimonadota bacterium]